MDVLLGRRNSRTKKIKTLSKVAISRTAILERQRQVRLSHARSDVVQLLNLGNHERALLRAEYVIQEQNMLDVLSMIEAYCQLIVQKTSLVKKHEKCPDELREAIASLVYAASRCGEFPELQELRRIISKKYGKEFVARAVELPGNTGVNPKIMQKLSMRRPSFDSRLMALKGIASENGIQISLHSVNTDERKAQETSDRHGQPEPKSDDKNIEFKDEISAVPRGEEQEEVNEDGQKFCELTSPVTGHKYRDVADAAQDAFESAAYAAAAARAAVALSRSESDSPESPDHHDDLGCSPSWPPRSGKFRWPGHRTVQCTTVADQNYSDGKEASLDHISANRPAQQIPDIGFDNVYYGREIRQSSIFR